MNKLELITLEDYEEPLIKASELAAKLGYAKKDAVSALVNNRAKDFDPNEALIFTTNTGKALYLSEGGAIKVCMFSEASRAKDVRREIVEVYKAWRRGEYFTSKQLTPAEQALLQAKNILKIAQQQVRLEREFEEHKQALKLQQEEIKDTKSAVAELANKVEKIAQHRVSKSGDLFVSDEQASEISQSVKLIAYELGKRSRKNEYASVYGELYRQFGITSYKRMPVERFDEAMSFLEDWHEEVAAQEEPQKDEVSVDDLPF